MDGQMMLQEQATMDIAMPENLKQETREIREILLRKEGSIEKVIEDIIEISNNATYETRDGGFAPDYKLRMNAKKLLLESAGYITKKSAVDIKFNMTKYLFGE